MCPYGAVGFVDPAEFFHRIDHLVERGLPFGGLGLALPVLERCARDPGGLAVRVDRGDARECCRDVRLAQRSPKRDLERLEVVRVLKLDAAGAGDVNNHDISLIGGISRRFRPASRSEETAAAPRWSPRAAPVARN